MADVRDVAAAIMSSVGECTTMKLQKLLYYCQGWHLAWCGVPLFDADIEAWTDGPVVREIYKSHRGRLNLSDPWPHSGDAARLNANESESVRLVIDRYGDKSADELSDSAHNESPWIEAREGMSETELSSKLINPGVMQDFFTDLWATQDPGGNAEVARAARAEMKRMVESGTYSKTAVSSSELIAMLREE